MQTSETLEHFLFLPELKLKRIKSTSNSGAEYFLEKHSEFEVCPKCARPSSRTYDHRIVKVKDEPIRGKHVVLYIRKRRLWCNSCYKPFTEPVSGISKGGRLTERLKRAIYNACLSYKNLSTVQKKMRCSSRTVYKVFYSQMEKKRETTSLSAPIRARDRRA